MRATLLLADAAQANDKVNALGLGWNIVTSPLPPHAIVIWFFAEWHEANQPHVFKLELVDEDGNTVQLPSENGELNTAVSIGGEFEVGRPAGLVRGTELVQPLAVNIPQGMPLRAGRYEYRLAVNELQVANGSFSVLAQA
ncbi:hypothetical protein [Agrococcus sp. SCSIO52902]|uniref:DUF6941 family protein n=1 Tax=Agrococcus sp. SCSIO52902 TaxID=2933290 RepID=UPI001FF16FE6|nr:hypothetical protein [Agrococcus sp. SCSIO52902]UOW01257.1 hypothetical protein MU522_02180 [Agrococcus sp. SCSIO52902]